MNKAAIITGIVLLIAIIVIVVMYNKKIKALTPANGSVNGTEDAPLDEVSQGTGIADDMTINE